MPSRPTVKSQAKALKHEVRLEQSLLLPVISGVDVRRYAALPCRQWIIFPYSVTGGIPSLLDWHRVEESTPNVARYLKETEGRLRAREKGRFNDDHWYRFGRNQNIGIQTRPKICVPRLVDRLRTTADMSGIHCMDNVDVNGVVPKQRYSSMGLAYLAGLLNSRLLTWVFPNVSAPFRGGFWSANRQFLGQLPIRLIDFTDSSDKSRHDHVVELVERMLSLHERLADGRTGHDKTIIQHQIDATDRQIDRLVYELYGLTAQDIKIVEGASELSGSLSPKQ